MMAEVTRERIVRALSGVLDPEVGINVIDLGLIYGIDVNIRDVRLEMTMTTPACPLGSYLNQAAERAIRAQIPEVMGLEIEMVWRPEWNPLMMSQSAKRQMGLPG